MWIIRGAFAGAVVGAALVGMVSFAIGAIVGAFAGATSLGSGNNLHTAWALKGTLAGLAGGGVAGALLGLLMGAFDPEGRNRFGGALIGAAVGMLSLGIGGAALGSLSQNDAPANGGAVFTLLFVGAAAGLIPGSILGFVCDLGLSSILTRPRGIPNR